MKQQWRITQGAFVGRLVYAGRDCYGVANDDTRATGIEHTSVSFEECGEPFFTIAKNDLEEIVEKLASEVRVGDIANFCGAWHKIDKITDSYIENGYVTLHSGPCVSHHTPKTAKIVTKLTDEGVS